MRISHLITCTTVAILLTTPKGSAAQALPTAQASPSAYGAGLSGALGVTQMEGRGYGLSLVAGVAASASWATFTLNPLDVTLAPDADEGRHRTEVVNGQTVCRDVQRDRYVDNTFCGVTPVFAVSGDVMVGIPRQSGPIMTFGAGYRALSARGPYAVAAIQFGRLTQQRWYLRAKGNGTFMELSVGVFLDPRSPARRR